MTTVLAAVAPVFLLIALGWGLRASGFLPLERWGAVERLAIYVLYPGFLVPAIWTADLSGAAAGAVGFSVTAGVVLTALATLALKPLLPLPGPGFTSLFQGVTRWNTFVFLPVVQAVFGPAGLALAGVVVSALIPVVNIMAVLVLARWGEGQGGTSPGRVALALVKNPILVACFAGVLLNISGLRPLPGLSPALHLLGEAALPLGLLLAGAGLSFRYAATRPWTIGAASAVKLLALPVLMWGLCVLFGGDRLAQGVVLMCGAAPGAAASYVLARQMGGDAPLVAGITAATTTASALTMPLLLALFHFG